jgi:drug/metabolite transporter (DMT)-like permease
MAILLLVLPSNSLPDAAATPWVLLACLSSLCYAAENIYLTRKTISDIGPIRIACGMNVMAIVLLGPLAIAFDQMFLPTLPFTTLEWSLIGLGGISAIAYTLYVLTVKRYGPVFASQVGYLVTISGVFWGMAIFSEVHSTWVWASLALMMIGLALVSPRQQENA